MVSKEIGHSSVVMTEKYNRFNLRKFKDDFPSLANRIDVRLTPPTLMIHIFNLLRRI